MTNLESLAVRMSQEVELFGDGPDKAMYTNWDKRTEQQRNVYRSLARVAFFGSSADIRQELENEDILLDASFKSNKRMVELMRENEELKKQLAMFRI